MIAFRITAPRYREIVIGDSDRGPLFTQDDLVQDRPASFLLEAGGVLKMRMLGQHVNTADMFIDRCELPTWAPKAIA